MKIMLDGLLLFLNNGQIGNYSRSIVDNLIKYSSVDIDIVKDYEINSNKYSGNSVEVLLNRKNNDFSALAALLKNSDAKIYHCLNNGLSIPKNFDFTYIMSINNLLPIIHEDLCPDMYLSNFYSKFPYGVLNSSYIICPSISTKEDFLNSFSINSENIYVNYGAISKFYGVTDRFLSSIYIKSKFNIEYDFIIFSGDFNKRKNIDKCIILLSELEKYLKNIKLVIVSDSFSDNSYLDFLKDISKKLNVYDNVIYLSNISIRDKVNLLNKSIFFIDLSIYENVNLDIIEAFSCNIPIICSDIKLYREYLGDSAFYYNEEIDPILVLNYINKYNCGNKELVLDKFSEDISLKCSLNVYNKVE